MTDEQLIEYVKLRPVLYNKTFSQYRDQTVRNIAWEEIAEQLNTPAEELKERWGKLRNLYNSALQRRRKKSNLKYPWKFEKEMEFLMPFIDGKLAAINSSSNNFTNDEDSTHDSELHYSDESAASPPPPAQSPAPEASSSQVIANNTAKHRIKSESDDALLRDMVDIMKSSHAVKLKRTITDMDEHDHFFLSMSKQLKTLPPTDQAEIKFQLHKLIHESEIKMFNNYK
ncbi:unnamed protein product [Diatraea saccharalis]|uniref:Transcription factor Adf-1 n=1 Tax=Diatraea saccharalis TaxID=40085 RepID=A0A9N9R389_9NEOP|nr:unnamed protein product [Diatraea saccharalis]